MAFSNLEKAMALIIGIDIATPGFSRMAAKQSINLIGKAGMALGPRAVAAVPAVASYSPVATGTALGLGALQTQPGQQLLEAAGERGRMDRIRFEQALTDLTIGVQKKKAKSSSKFNKAIKVGMSTVKKSTSYGAKGVISNPKKAFSAVTKTASAILKGKKLPKVGIKRKIALSIRSIL
jgi:hypothetical protein